MKYCTLLILFVALAIRPAIAQEKSLKRFYREHRNEGTPFKIGVGGVLLHFASWVMPRSSGETSTMKDVLSKVHHVKIYTIEGASIEPSSIHRLKQSLIDRDHFETLMEVRDSGSIVHMLNKGKGDELGNVVMLVQDDSDFVMVHLRTSLQMNDVNALIRQFADN